MESRKECVENRERADAQTCVTHSCWGIRPWWILKISEAIAHQEKAMAWPGI